MTAHPTRIYSYGALRPTAGAELVEEQYRLAHRYHNVLVGLEQVRRETYAGLIAPFFPPDLADEIEVLDAAIAAGREAIKQQRKGAGKRADVEGEQEHVEALRALRLPLYERQRTARSRINAVLASIRKDTQTARDASGQSRISAAKRAELATAIVEARTDLDTDHRAFARAMIALELEHTYWTTLARTLFSEELGLFWGTYLLVEGAVGAARGTQGGPRFRRWDGSGRIGVQFQGGITGAELLAAEDPRLRIVPEKPRPTLRNPHGRPVKPSERVAQLRIGSDGRAPILADFPIVLDRPLPDDAVIKWAWILRRKVGLRYEYRLQLSTQSEDFEPAPQPAGAGVLAINLGWRRLLDSQGTQTGEIRVAYWRDDSGRSGQLLVPEGTRYGLRKASELRAIRDRHFDLAKLWFRCWLDASEIPDWLRTRTRYLAQWRAPAQFAGLLAAWKAQRFDGDAGMLGAVEAWAIKDRHLLAWEANERQNALARRQNAYRVFAKWATQTYAVVLVDNMDLRDVAKAPEAEEGVPSDGRDSRSTRTVAAPSQLRLALRDAAPGSGALFVEEETAFTTRTCAACGVCEKWDAAPSVTHVCAFCGAVMDQDDNNVRVRLIRYASGGVTRRPGKALARASAERGAEVGASVEALAMG